MTDREQYRTTLRAGLEDAAAGVRPVDLYDRALARSRQIGRRRSIVAGAATVMVAFGGATAVTVSARLTDHVVPTPTPSATTSAPTTPPSVVPTTAGPGSTTPPPTSSPPQVDPDGAARFALKDARLTLPAWPPPPREWSECRTDVTLVDGVGGFNNRVTLGTVVAQDVDRDGTAEAVALFTCNDQYGDTYTQVAAYRLPESGPPTLLGQVVTRLTTREGVANVIQLGTEIESGTRDTVRVELVMGVVSLRPTYEPLRQWRGYTWDGTAFRQTSGPEGFLLGPLQETLATSAGKPVFGEMVDGCRTQTITVTLRNITAKPVTDVSVTLLDHNLGYPDTGCDPPATQATDSALVPVGSVAPGQARKVEVVVKIRGTAVGGRARSILVQSGPRRFAGGLALN